MAIAGLGPHGERATPPASVTLTQADIDASREAGFTVAIVMHTLEGDYSRQQLAGLVGTLGECGAVVLDVFDCGFDAGRQTEAIKQLASEKPDAIISLPIGNADVAEAYRMAARNDVKLILLDNVPTGLVPGSDYISMVSADNFGLGQIAAELLEPHIRHNGTIGVIAYGADFHATNQREVAFEKWMLTNRPDISRVKRKFASIELAQHTTEALLDEAGELDGLFVVWEAPAIEALTALQTKGLNIPLTTIDLGERVAMELARGNIIKGIGAQQPFLQGVSCAQTTIHALLGNHPPAWVALPGLTVGRENVIESWQTVWRAPAPKELAALRRQG